MFDGDAANLKVFLEAIRHRSEAFNWQRILIIPDSSTPPVNRDLLTEYGLLTLKDIRAHASTYVETPTRLQQDNYMLYLCLYGSVTRDITLKAVMQADTYRVGTKALPCGTLFLKVILNSCTVDTFSTVDTIRKRLSNLDSYIGSVDDNIESFNGYVRFQRDALLARGHQSTELLTNLFSAYETVEDTEFHSFITHLRHDMINGKLEITEDSLMIAAENRYLSLKETTMWKKGSDKDAQIIALTARLETLESKKKVTKEKKANKQGQKDIKAKKPQWFNNPPKPGEPKSRKVEGKTYFWCPAHKAWVQHSPEECRLKNAKKEETKQKTTEKTSNSTLRLATALATLIEANSEDE